MGGELTKEEWKKGEEMLRLEVRNSECPVAPVYVAPQPVCRSRGSR